MCYHSSRKTRMQPCCQWDLQMHQGSYICHFRSVLQVRDIWLSLCLSRVLWGDWSWLALFQGSPERCPPHSTHMMERVFACDPSTTQSRADCCCSLLHWQNTYSSQHHSKLYHPWTDWRDRLSCRVHNQSSTPSWALKISQRSILDGFCAPQDQW